MFAVIKTGGKQYLVTPGQELTVEKLDIEAGKPVSFEEVLLISDKDLKLGNPMISKAKVTGTVSSHGRAAKVTTIKFHNKVRYRRKIGHRQHWTKVKIDKISA